MAYLAARRGLGIKPGVERIAGLLDVMGEPHRAYPAVHVAGTNGKTSTVRIAASVLGAHGLVAGSFTSPPLDRVEDQFARNGEAIAPDDLGAALADVLPFLELYEGDDGPVLTEFEVAVGFAFSWFAATAADVAVVEAGMGGRDDATNVLDAAVAVITGVALDHTDHLGGSIADIAANKVAIVTEGATLVTGPLPSAAEPAIAARLQATGAEWWRYDREFRIEALTQAVGGWVVDLDGVYEHYGDVFLPLFGGHQARNLAVAVASCEALLGRALDPEAVRAGAASVSVPGRLETASRTPLVVLDVAHNPDGVAAVADALAEAFLPTQWTVVFGARGRRDPAAMLAPLAGSVARLLAVAADDPEAIPAAAIVAAAPEALGPVPVTEVASVAEAIPRAIAAADGGGVLVIGSHRIVAEARALLQG